MKNWNITQRINQIQIIYFLIVVLLISLSFFILVKKLIFKEVNNTIENIAQQAQIHVEKYKSDVENSAEKLTDLIKDDQLVEANPKYLEELINSNSKISTVFIYNSKIDSLEFSKIDSTTPFNINDWKSINRNLTRLMIAQNINSLWKTIPNKDSIQYDLFYSKKMAQNQYILFSFNWSWIYNYIENFQRSKDVTILIYRPQKSIVYFPNITNLNHDRAQTMIQLADYQIQNYLQKDKTLKIKHGFTIKGFRLFKHGPKYLTFIEQDENSGWYILINQSYSNLYSSFFIFFRNSGIILIIVIFLGILFILYSNRNKIDTTIEVLELIENGKSIQVKQKENESDWTFIKRTIELMQNQLKHYALSIERNAIERSKLDNELKLAQKLQKNIMPASHKAVSKRDRFEIYAISESAYDIGGDLHDYFLIDNDHLLFTVGDVSGKGIPAALFMIFTHTLLRSVAQTNHSVEQIVSTINNRLIEDNLSDLFVTLFVGVLQLSTGELTYCNAAHCLPIIVRSNGTLEELNQTHGIPVGLYSNRDYSKSQLQLKEGDSIIIYSDGLIESKDENGMTFSEDVLKFNLVGTWFDPVDVLVNKVLSSLNSFLGNQKPCDDLTIMALKYTGNQKIKSTETPDILR